MFEIAIACQPLMAMLETRRSRSEIGAVLEAEGGWNKASIARFRKLDSVLKEVGRVHGFTLNI